MHSLTTVSYSAGTPPAARCYQLAGVARLRPQLLLPSPAPTCHRPSATAAPRTSNHAFTGASIAPCTASRALLVVGAAVRSGAGPGPPSGPSHGGGRGRRGGRGYEGARRQGDGPGRREGERERERDGGSRAGRPGTPPHPPRRPADRRAPAGASGHDGDAYSRSDPTSSG